jgi:hypothetical protein
VYPDSPKDGHLSRDTTEAERIAGILSEFGVWNSAVFHRSRLFFPILGFALGRSFTDKFARSNFASLEISIEQKIVLLESTEMPRQHFSCGRVLGRRFSKRFLRIVCYIPAL